MKSDQMSLFERLPLEEVRQGWVESPRGVEVDEHLSALARKLGNLAHFGTSSWSFPGWKGLVYETNYSAELLARDGLKAYSAHPLLRTVSIDRTYYAPIARGEYETYAAQVSEGFRFMVKAPAEITTPWLRDSEGKPAGDNPRYLDAKFAFDQYVIPAYEGLGKHCGPLVFQFPPQGRTITRDAHKFADRLYRFLSALTPAPLYAIELRDAALVTDAYVEVLRATGARHCVSVHPRAGTVQEQTDIISALGTGPLVARWNLNAKHTYDEAKTLYAPFDKLIDEDVRSRVQLAKLCAESLNAKQPVFLIANNKAEGSAPRTVFKLAEEIAARV